MSKTMGSKFQMFRMEVLGVLQGFNQPAKQVWPRLSSPLSSLSSRSSPRMIPQGKAVGPVKRRQCNAAKTMAVWPKRVEWHFMSAPDSGPSRAPGRGLGILTKAGDSWKQQPDLHRLVGR